MDIKIKINEVAKSFEKQGKEIIEILKNEAPGDRRYAAMTVIDEDEFNIIFESLTNKYSVESFDEFEAGAQRIAVAQPIVEEKQPEAPKPAAEKPAKKEEAPKAEQKPVKKPEAEQKKPAVKEK